MQITLTPEEVRVLVSALPTEYALYDIYGTSLEVARSLAKRRMVRLRARRTGRRGEQMVSHRALITDLGEQMLLKWATT